MVPIPSSQWALLEPKDRPIDMPKGEKQMTYYELSYNGKIFKFTMDEFGSRPNSGYALYIALHGGGRLAKETEEEAKRKNNGFWYSMASGLYRKNFKGGIQIIRIAGLMVLST
jgi:hypothetical protein